MMEYWNDGFVGSGKTGMMDYCCHPSGMCEWGAGVRRYRCAQPPATGLPHLRRGARRANRCGRVQQIESKAAMNRRSPKSSLAPSLRISVPSVVETRSRVPQEARKRPIFHYSTIPTFQSSRLPHLRRGGRRANRCGRVQQIESKAAMNRRTPESLRSQLRRHLFRLQPTPPLNLSESPYYYPKSSGFSDTIFVRRPQHSDSNFPFDAISTGPIQPVRSQSRDGSATIFQYSNIPIFQSSPLSTS